MKTVKVTTNSLEIFKNEFGKLVKKCNKLDFPTPYHNDPVEYLVNTGEHNCFGEPIKETVWDVEVTYETPIINGWKVVGNREVSEDMVILNTIDNDTDLTSYNKSNKIYCEHCGTNHRRKKSVLIKNENTGTVIEVGTACLKDFIPIPFKTFLIFNYFVEMFDENEVFKSTDKIYNYDIKSVLIVTVALIREYGYTSKKKAYELDTLSTSELVWMYFNKKDEIKVDIKDEDKEKAYNTIEYFKSLDPEKYYDNNYMSNCIKLLNKEYFDVKYIGYVTSTIVCYEKSLNKSKSEHVKSEFIGNVNERIKNYKCVLVSLKRTEGYYGITDVLNFKDNNGNILVSFYSGKNDYTDYINKSVDVTGTISKHNEFRNIKQTILKRVNVKGV